MEYNPQFSKDFMDRTMQIVTDYKGPHDATLLINCLLGLLVLPKEALLKKTPAMPSDTLDKWGIHPSSIKNPGKCEYGHQHDLSLQQLIRRMRNAVAHFQVAPFSKNSEVAGFTFKDRNGFHAEITLSELKKFVIKLSEHLKVAA